MADIQAMLRDTAQKVGDYVKDAATLTVETRWVPLSDTAPADFDASKPVARTVIKLDGDNASVIPLRQGSAGSLEVDEALFSLHERNVTSAIEYRARMLNIMLGALRSLTE